MTTDRLKPIEILLVEDNEGDVRLTQEALREGKIRNNLHVAKDGAEAMAYLRSQGRDPSKPRPDIVLLDLNLPKVDGRHVLAALKADPALRVIPVVVMTSSKAEEDVVRSYEQYANCYVTKPVDFEQFVKIVQAIEDFWFTIVKLPS